MKHLANTLSTKELLEKGTYTLMISVSGKLQVSVGKLGLKAFLPGYYAYTGSALGKGATSLPNRLARHLKAVKSKHWHIDFLLGNENVTVEAVFCVSNGQNLECQVNQSIRRQLNAEILIPEFGASDCRNQCKSHLLYFGRRNAQLEIRALFERKFGEDSVFISLQDSCSKP